MSGDYDKGITIQKAMRNIVERRYLLPAIQRKFEWDIDRICVLFDSIMRGYPINTFMLWEVTDQDIKKKFKFYLFLEKYCEMFAEDNPDFPTTGGHGNFHAVVDGQQRLTSIYIGLRGTYANKLPRRRWPRTHDEAIFPPRSLHLNLSEGLDEESNESLMCYDFRFLTKEDLTELSKDKLWFKVGDILDFDDAESEASVLDIVMSYLDKIGQSSNGYARKTLIKLYFKIRREPLIVYFNETSQQIDHVLDIFIRTNSGGKPLSFSHLLMSIAVANWQEDARQQIDKLVKDVWQSPDMGFLIDRDWVLKAALAITNADLRFKVKNFSADSVAIIEREWEEIKACVLASFKLIRLMGLQDDSLRAKNAVIPIAYYLFHKGRDAGSGKPRLYAEINNLAKHAENRQAIAQWLMMSLLRRVFGGQSDSLLTNLRKIIKENLLNDKFPLLAIVEAYKGTNKDLIFDDDFIDQLLETQKDDPMCYTILALLMPTRICTSLTGLHKDHLHPAAEFKAERLDQRKELFKDKPEKRSFFEKPENWNTIANLHLLDGAMNQSKQDTPLEDWIKSQNVALPVLLIPTETPLDFESFPSFIEKRRIELIRVLKQLGKT